MNPRLLNYPTVTVPCRPSTWGACLIDPIYREVYKNDRSDQRNPADEIMIRKHTYDGFFKTELLAFLKTRDIEAVLVSGAETNACVMRTAETAALHQFRTIILRDCVWSHMKEEHCKSALANFKEVYGWVLPAIEDKTPSPSVLPRTFGYTLADLNELRPA
jgi:nicotinamidase-related amidase